MDDAVYFVREPPVAKLEGNNVYVEVHSGGRTFRFEGPINVFIQTFAHFAQVVGEWRVEQGADVLPFRREYVDNLRAGH